MKTKAFGNNINPACKHCTHIEHKKGKYLCNRKCREVPPENHCIWYRYDPIERIPNVSPELPKYNLKDFSVN